MNRLILCALICLSTSYVCIPLIGGGAGAIASQHSSNSKKTQQEFSTNFQHTNTEREAHGLKPLDWCSETYRFDKGWAQKDKGCAAKIKAYETGDLTALNAPTINESSTSTAAFVGSKAGATIGSKEPQ